MPWKRDPRPLAGEPAPGSDEALGAALRGMAALLREEGEGLLELVRDQESQLEQALSLMGEGVAGFGQALANLDRLSREQHKLALDLQHSMQLQLEGQEGPQPLEVFTGTVLNTLDTFVEAMLEIGQASFQMVEETESIRGRSVAMRGALVELAEVAARTHLLALNASIEAAHARRYGAGFAIVASEVQKLADRSGALSDHISGLVADIEAALERTTGQVEAIAGKDLNQIIQSKQMADGMVRALGESEATAQRMVGQLEEIGRQVAERVEVAIRSLQFEDMVRQLLAGVVERNAALSRRAGLLVELSGRLLDPSGDPGATFAAALEQLKACRHARASVVQAESLNAGDVDLF